MPDGERPRLPVVTVYLFTVTEKSCIDQGNVLAFSIEKLAQGFNPDWVWMASVILSDPLITPTEMPFSNRGHSWASIRAEGNFWGVSSTHTTATPAAPQSPHGSLAPFLHSRLCHGTLTFSPNTAFPPPSLTVLLALSHLLY